MAPKMPIAVMRPMLLIWSVATKRTMPPITIKQPIPLYVDHDQVTYGCQMAFATHDCQTAHDAPDCQIDYVEGFEAAHQPMLSRMSRRIKQLMALICPMEPK